YSKEAEFWRKVLPRVAYDGPTGLEPAGDVWQLIGSGILDWVMPLQGKQVFEFSFAVKENAIFALQMCAEDGNGLLTISMNGKVHVHDAQSRIDDEVGEGEPVFIGRRHKL